MLMQLWFIFSGSESSDGSSGFGWSQVLAFGVVILVMAIMPRIIRKIRHERNALARQETKTIENRPNIRNQADSVLVELAEMSREINAQADTKIRVLNKLVRDAEMAVKKYEELIERRERLAGVEGGSLPLAEKEEGGNLSADAAQIRIEQDISGANSGGKPDSDGVKGNDSPGHNKRSATTADSGVWQDTVGNKIRNLHNMGCDVSEIARKTRLSTSEVTLMLNLLNLEE